jgi:hypothetical protein
MERAYLAAIEASDKRNALMDQSIYRAALGHDGEALAMFGLAPDRRCDDIETSRRLHLEAQDEDLASDWLASVVVLFADLALRRLERGVLAEDQIGEGYGPTYNDGVRLTTLLRVGGNAIRHVSEWDDNETLQFPYDEEQVRRDLLERWSDHDAQA